MPTISSFYGIVIRMHWLERDHPPPHFHAIYGDQRAVINIETLEEMEGRLPRRAKVHVLEWADEHRAELLENWELCAKKQQPKKIPPLE